MKILATVILALLCCTASVAQTHRDPLNEREVEQLRDSAQEPKKRIDLLLSFVRERMLALERLHGATHPGTNDTEKFNALLGDVAALLDELDDNLAMYDNHSEDLRRPLRHVLDVEAEFDRKLKSLEQSASSEGRKFSAALAEASESLTTSMESAQAMLASQIEKKGEEKADKKADRQEAKEDRKQRDPQPDYTGMGGIGQQQPAEP